MFLKMIVKVEALNSGKIRYTGGYLRAFFLSTVKMIDSEFASKLHAPHRAWGLAPYAITPMYRDGIDETSYIPISITTVEGKTYCFEIKVVEKVFVQIIKDLIKSLHRTFSLSNISFRTLKVELEWLKEANVSSEFFKVFFRTPTYFRVVGIDKHYLFPTADKVVYSVAKILNVFSEEKMEKEYLQKEIIPMISEEDYDLKTIKPVRLGGRRAVIGFTGTITYRTKSRESSKTFLKFLQVAEYMNIGGNRTGGFGVIHFEVKRQ